MGQTVNLPRALFWRRVMESSLALKGVALSLR